VFLGRSAEEKKAMRKNMQTRIDQIRDNCKQVLELDVDIIID